jgi:biopolymer transport protein ExbD
MLRRPSSQRRGRGHSSLDELPLVPIMDAFVTLVAFLLMATSLLAVTLIDTPVPVVSSSPPDNKRPLSLTVHLEQDRLRIESPFGLVPKVEIPRVETSYDFVKFHDALLEIKNKFPLEKQIILMPSATTEYNDIVRVMDAARQIRPADPPLYIKNDQGQDVVVTDLFSDVVFGNILGGI